MEKAMSDKEKELYFKNINKTGSNKNPIEKNIDEISLELFKRNRRKDYFKIDSFYCVKYHVLMMFIRYEIFNYKESFSKISKNEQNIIYKKLRNIAAEYSGTEDDRIRLSYLDIVSEYIEETGIITKTEESNVVFEENWKYNINNKNVEKIALEIINKSGLIL